MTREKIRFIVFGGLFITLVFVTTAIVPHVPIPFTEGYIHTGDSMIFIAAVLFGWKYGAIAGGLGSALADLYLEYAHWALPTLIIKGLMGVIVGLIAHNSHKRSKKFSIGISSSIVGIWIILAFWLKNLLSTILQKPDVSAYLMQKLELNNISELTVMISRVQLVLTIAIVLIPLFVIIVSIVINKNSKYLNSNNLLGMLLAGIWMVTGYYFAGGILKGNMIVPIFSIPANILQFVGGGVIAYFIISALDKTKFIDNLSKKS